MPYTFTYHTTNTGEPVEANYYTEGDYRESLIIFLDAFSGDIRRMGPEFKRRYKQDIEAEGDDKVLKEWCSRIFTRRWGLFRVAPAWVQRIIMPSHPPMHYTLSPEISDDYIKICVLAMGLDYCYYQPEEIINKEEAEEYMSSINFKGKVLTFKNMINEEDPFVIDLSAYDIDKAYIKKALTAAFVKIKSRHKKGEYETGDFIAKNSGVMVAKPAYKARVDAVGLPSVALRGIANTLMKQYQNHDDEIGGIYNREIRRILIKERAAADLSGYIYEGAKLKLKSQLKKELCASLLNLKSGEVVNIIDSQYTKNMLVDGIKRCLVGKESSTADYSQYKLAALKEIDVNVKSYIKKIYEQYCAIYDRRNPDYSYTIAISLKEMQTSESKEISLDIDSLYEMFGRDCKNFSAALRNSSSRDGSNYHNWSTISNHWKHFNNIKVNLMLTGMKEKQAVEKIIETCFDSTLDYRGNKIPLEKAYSVCAITKQVIPNYFAERVILLDKREIIANVYYLIYQNGRTNTYQGDVKRLAFIEQKVPAEHVPLIDIFDYQFNALNYLSPLSAEKENIEVFSKGKTYQPTPYFGVELEIERTSECPLTITRNVLDALGRDFVVLKRDSSIHGTYPFEVVTVPATLAAQKEHWKQFMEARDIKKYLSSYASGNCGMHIHISRDAFTGLHLAKFLRFINLQDNRTFIEKVAQRISQRHAAFMGEEKDYQKDLVHKSRQFRGEQGDRHVAVNTSNNKGTIELRIFRGNLAKGHFYKNLEFAHALWLYTKDCNMKDLGYKDFIMWVFKQNDSTYKNLMQWLVSSNLNVSNKNFDKDETDVAAKKKEIKKVQLVINRKYNTKDTDVLRKMTKDSVLLKSELVANQ